MAMESIATQELIEQRLDAIDRALIGLMPRSVRLRKMAELEKEVLEGTGSQFVLADELAVPPASPRASDATTPRGRRTRSRLALSSGVLGIVALLLLIMLPFASVLFVEMADEVGEVVLFAILAFSIVAVASCGAAAVAMGFAALVRLGRRHNLQVGHGWAVTGLCTGPLPMLVGGLATLMVVLPNLGFVRSEYRNTPGVVYMPPENGRPDTFVVPVGGGQPVRLPDSAGPVCTAPRMATAPTCGAPVCTAPTCAAPAYVGTPECRPTPSENVVPPEYRKVPSENQGSTVRQQVGPYVDSVDPPPANAYPTPPVSPDSTIPPAEDTPTLPGATTQSSEQAVTVRYALRNAAVTDAAEKLTASLGLSGEEFVIDPETNALTATALPPDQKRIARLLATLDARPIHVTVQCLFTRIGPDGKRTVLSKPQIQTLDGTEAMFSIGHADGDSFEVSLVPQVILSEQERDAIKQASFDNAAR